MLSKKRERTTLSEEKTTKPTNGKTKEVSNDYDTELINHDKKRKYSTENNTVSEISSFGISKEIEVKLKERGITALFEVQQKVFFPVFNGENTIVASLTGSGKTLSFILPILERFKQKEKFTHTEPVVIVLAPTRELAVQISNEFKTLSANYVNKINPRDIKNKTGKPEEVKVEKNKDENFKNNFTFNVAAVYGGVSIDDQKYELKRGVDIVVGTPGRVLDMINRGELKLTNIRMGVLDEADKMLEMGFQEPIEEIFDLIYQSRPKLQVCLFSATMHKWVVDTAKKIMRNKEHTFVNLVANLKGRIPVGVEHLAVNCLRNEKITTIADLSKLKNF